MLKKILVLFDETDCSIRALDYAVKLCSLSEGEVVVMTSVKTEMKVKVEAAPLDKELRVQANDELVKIGNRILGVAKQILDKEQIRVQYLLEFGMPSETAMNAVEKFHCDTIVVGSRGLGTFKGLLSDSVSNKLIQTAKVPVVVIK
ncbi:MAG TPA: universal stress protein [Candidatus Avacidaminococcus intestinavium]|uniref:Universal stress protein n=1 Tax=Candidatus Avacidaminococcus intestinavium TaxID=2840684 RepID=A0A9D1MRA1_9FIRM|nr:universal stress protein [Candidatus Avacidaminococcus intestinavium]